MSAPLDVPSELARFAGLSADEKKQFLATLDADLKEAVELARLAVRLNDPELARLAEKQAHPLRQLAKAVTRQVK